MGSKKLIHGWGINDVNYKVSRCKRINGKSKAVWRCPYYIKWVEMIRRCYDPSFHKRRPTYEGCTVCDEWKYLSSFIEWVDSQTNKNWINCVPDKDILVKNNKHYSRDTVVFIEARVNTFVEDCGKVRGRYMIGVDPSGRKKNPYRSQCKNPFGSGGTYIGMFPTELEAHLAWQARKHQYACQLADLQSDPRVAKALIERYAPDKDWTKA